MIIILTIVKILVLYIRLGSIILDRVQIRKQLRNFLGYLDLILNQQLLKCLALKLLYLKLEAYLGILLNLLLHLCPCLIDLLHNLI